MKVEATIIERVLVMKRLENGGLIPETKTNLAHYAVPSSTQHGAKTPKKNLHDV
jgi:hypothetical protein